MSALTVGWTDAPDTVAISATVVRADPDELVDLAHAFDADRFEAIELFAAKAAAVWEEISDEAHARRS